MTDSPEIPRNAFPGDALYEPPPGTVVSSVIHEIEMVIEFDLTKEEHKRAAMALLDLSKKRDKLMKYDNRNWLVISAIIDWPPGSNPEMLTCRVRCTEK